MSSQSERVKITPEMQPVLQAVWEKYEPAKREYEAQTQTWTNALGMCAKLLGIDPATILGFDVPQASFVIRPKPDDEKQPDETTHVVKTEDGAHASVG